MGRFLHWLGLGPKTGSVLIGKDAASREPNAHGDGLSSNEWGKTHVLRARNAMYADLRRAVVIHHDGLLVWDGPELGLRREGREGSGNGIVGEQPQLGLPSGFSELAAP